MPDQTVYNERGGVTGVCLPATAPNPPDPNGLIAALRRQVVSVFGSSIQIPEALPDFEMRDPGLETNPALAGGDLVLPLVAIMADKPREMQTAVNRQCFTVPVDFIYVQAEAAGVDGPQVIRGLLHPLAVALFADYRQFAGWDVNACFNTRITATPMDRLNEYQSKFRALGRKVEVGVLSAEFDYQEIPYAF